MESIRNFLKSWPGRIFLILCLSPLALFGIEGYFHSDFNPNEVVRVGEQSITKADFQNALSARRDELTTRIDPSLINEDVLKDQVLQELIDAALLQHQTQKLGMAISDATINDMLVKEQIFQDENNEFSKERFAFYLQQRRMNKQQLFNELRQQLSLMQLNTSITNTAVYPTRLINELIDLQEESRQVWLKRYAWKDYADEVSISSDDINAYYNEHQNDLKSKAMVDLSYIVLSKDSLNIEPVTDEEIKAQYEVYKQQNSNIDNRQISQILLTGDDAQTQIIAIKERLNKGESFEQLAKMYSQDEGSRMYGGDIGTFNPDVFNNDAAIVEQALDGLSVNDVSEPVKTAYGYHLFKITGADANRLPSITQMYEQLKAEVVALKKETLLTDIITAINEMAVDGASIEDIGELEGLKVKKLLDYPKDNNQTMLNQPAVINAAFNEFNIQNEAVSTHIDVDDVTVWVQPSNYRPIAPLSLEAATPQIKMILTKNRAIDIAFKQAQQAAENLNSSDLDNIDKNSDYQNLGTITRQSSVLSEDERTAVFGHELENSSRVALAQQTALGASVLVMEPMQQQSKLSMPKDMRMRTATLIRDNRGEDQLEDYLNFLRSTVEIVRHEEAIEDLNEN